MCVPYVAEAWAKGGGWKGRTRGCGDALRRGSLPGWAERERERAAAAWNWVGVCDARKCAACSVSGRSVRLVNDWSAAAHEEESLPPGRRSWAGFMYAGQGWRAFGAAVVCVLFVICGMYSVVCRLYVPVMLLVRRAAHGRQPGRYRRATLLHLQRADRGSSGVRGHVERLNVRSGVRDETNAGVYASMGRGRRRHQGPALSRLSACHGCHGSLGRPGADRKGSSVERLPNEATCCLTARVLDIPKRTAMRRRQADWVSE